MPSFKTPRWMILSVFLLFGFLIAAARLVDLQILRGSYFRELAEGNRVRRLPLKSARGEILDRNGRFLARNIPVYKLADFSAGGVVVGEKTISRSEALEIQAERPELVSRLVIESRREYPLGKAAAHLLGYVNEVSKQELQSAVKDCRKIAYYQLGDLKGRMGIEAQFDCLLRGVNGEELLEVDNLGRVVRSLGRKEPIPGSNIQVTIDAELQKIAYQALTNPPVKKDMPKLGEIRGAFVVQEAKTGKILALVSVPSFDPNRLSGEYLRLVKDDSLPLFNRAIAGVYPPGSTFKIIVAAGALEEKKIDKDFQYEDKGKIVINGFEYRNWYYTQYGKTEGLIDVVRAIARSTDTFFYKVGEMLGVDGIIKWADKFGFGKKTGIDLPGEADGFLPTSEWKKRVTGEPWFLGNTYHLAIGQGDLLATPLQVNVATSVIASGGLFCQPTILPKEQKCHKIGLSNQIVKLVTQGMIKACSPGGTAFPFFDFSPQVACKTGTAETGTGKTHAWLTVFAPADNPEIVATILIEEGGEGSKVAAPIMKKILEWWFNRKN